MRRTALVVLGICCLMGCFHTKPRIATTRGREEMNVALNQLIPPGTSATKAMAVLKREGFDYSPVTNGPIPEWGLDGPVANEQGDHISAERVASFIPFVPISGEWRWRVVLILKDGVVERHQTYVSLSGL